MFFMMSHCFLNNFSLLSNNVLCHYRCEFRLILLVSHLSHYIVGSNLSLLLVLAVQNMGASGTIAKEQEIEFSALEGSLSMMSKGLMAFNCVRLQLIS